MNPLFGQRAPIKGLGTYEPEFEKRQSSIEQFISRGGTVDTASDAKGKRIEWRMEGKLHRTDGPAVEWENGDLEWRQNDVLHRTDGPATISTCGSWWFAVSWTSPKNSAHFMPAYDKTDPQRNKRPAENSRIHLALAPVNWSKVSRSALPRPNEQQTEQWFFRGKPHRKDGPAMSTIYNNIACEQWYQYGQRHRMDGPAYESAEMKLWIQSGLLHRSDGPAVIEKAPGANSDFKVEAWYRFGLLHREDSNEPAVMATKNYTRTRQWFYKGQLHRENGPAFEFENYAGKGVESVKWFYHGNLHRTRGPAVDRPYEHADARRWFRHGTELEKPSKTA